MQNQNNKPTVGCSFSIGHTAYAHDVRLNQEKNSINKSLVKDNIILIDDVKANGCQTPDERINQIMQPYIDEYNAQQKRSDRKINDNYCDYWRKDISHEGMSMVKEFVIQYGERDNLGGEYFDPNTSAERKAEMKEEFTKTYTKALEEFQQKFPHQKVLWATIHFDEGGFDDPEKGGTPHLHVALLPIGEGYRKGLTHQVSEGRAYTNDGIERIKERKQAKNIENDTNGFQRSRFTDKVRNEILRPIVEHELGYSIKATIHGKKHVHQDDHETYIKNKKIIEQQQNKISENNRVQQQQKQNIEILQQEAFAIQKNQFILREDEKEIKTNIDKLKNKKENIAEKVQELTLAQNTLVDQNQLLEKTAQANGQLIENQKKQIEENNMTMDLNKIIEMTKEKKEIKAKTHLFKDDTVELTEADYLLLKQQAEVSQYVAEKLQRAISISAENKNKENRLDHALKEAERKIQEANYQKNRYEKLIEDHKNEKEEIFYFIDKKGELEVTLDKTKENAYTLEYMENYIASEKNQINEEYFKIRDIQKQSQQAQYNYYQNTFAEYIKTNRSPKTIYGRLLDANPRIGIETLTIGQKLKEMAHACLTITIEAIVKWQNEMRLEEKLAKEMEGPEHDYQRIRF